MLKILLTIAIVLSIFISLVTEISALVFCSSTAEPILREMDPRLFRQSLVTYYWMNVSCCVSSCSCSAVAVVASSVGDDPRCWVVVVAVVVSSGFQLYAGVSGARATRRLAAPGSVGPGFGGITEWRRRLRRCCPGCFGYDRVETMTISYAVSLREGGSGGETGRGRFDLVDERSLPEFRSNLSMNSRVEMESTN